MKKLLTTFVKYPFYANIIIAAIILAGSYSLISMKKSFFPERSTRFINITVAYPGASPKEMEEGVTSRIEQAIRGIVGIKEFTSTSSENFANVVIEINTDYNIDEALTEIKNAVDGISSFPVAAERPIVFKQRESTPAANMGLYGDADLETLKNYAYDIEDDLLNSGLISQISISGFPDIEISVEVKEEDLLRYNLTFDRIAAAIANNNRDVSAGEIRSAEEEVLIRARNRSVNPGEIGDIVLRANTDGSFLRIRDIANIKLKFSEVPNQSFINGKRGIFFNIRKLSTEDLVEISNFLNSYVEEFNSKHNGVQLDITFDFLTMLNSRLNLLLKNGGSGLLLVIISLALFLSLRVSLWVAWGIPSSFLGMFIFANLAGITINMISLFGMILVIGILVDDGIVIGENIYTHFEKGKSPRRAAIDGTLEVIPSIITSVTTTMVAFSPLLFLVGQMEIMYEMAFIVVVSLGVSLIEAIFVLPAHLANPHILKRNEKHSKFKNSLESFIVFMKDNFYSRLLKVLIRWRWVVVTIPVGLILITVGLIQGTIIKTTFFPSVAFDMFTVNIAFTPGSGEQQTIEYLELFDQKILEVEKELEEEFADSNKFITYTFRSVGFAFQGQEIGAHAGNINVMMRDMEGAPISTFQIAERVKQAIGEVPEAEKFTVGGVNRWGAPVSISLLGRDMSELERAKKYMEEKLKEFPELQNITDNNAEGKQEVRLKLKPKAYFLGLTLSDITNQVRQGFYGGQVQRLQQGKDEIRVWVRYPRQDRLTLGQMEKIKIKTTSGEYPLSELVDYNLERGPVSIKRYNAEKEVRVEADLLDPYEPVPPILARVNDEIIPKIKAQYPGITVEYQGQQKNSNEAVADLQKLFVIAFGLIILILILHFKSMTHAAIILMMIPLSFLGAAWGHGLHGQPISILSAWGMVALSGVIINDSVVFLSKFNSNLMEGLSVTEAVFEAGRSRFRAIMLTSITTVAGLYPIILENSFQAQFLIPMAISLAYGVLIGTGFTLLFFPVLIHTLNDVRVWKAKFLKRENVTPENVEPVIINSKVTVD
ncbi:MAG: efflux RND transporter permease subunit [Ignavibacteriales bacterium]|nr:efflux RND transporter permease subunit [Ignavibacteriales bacterium]MCB9259051.1 efflux RND transporter permease subunit [Ignavibacteriales bacterium]